MGKIVVFDSGFGSLSIIKAIQKTTKSDIIYFADQKNFPYGKKTKSQLRKIISKTMKMLHNHFNPDLIVIGSNTPSLLLEKNIQSNVVRVLPPIKNAVKISKTSCIAILTTRLVVRSKELSEYIKKNKIPKYIKIKKIDASSLVELVESGKFIDDQSFCKLKIKSLLKHVLKKNNIDTVTLSSTHLPFLLPLLKKEFPQVTFLNPANEVAQKIAKLHFKNKSKRNTIKIFTSSNPKIFEKNLEKIGIMKKVSFLA